MFLALRSARVLQLLACLATLGFNGVRAFSVLSATGAPAIGLGAGRGVGAVRRPGLRVVCSAQVICIWLWSRLVHMGWCAPEKRAVCAR